MAEFKEISPHASNGEKLLNWVDNRFPLSKMYKEHLSEPTLEDVFVDLVGRSMDEIEEEESNDEGD